jgi:hypothetical protein
MNDSDGLNERDEFVPNQVNKPTHFPPRIAIIFQAFEPGVKKKLHLIPGDISRWKLPHQQNNQSLLI